MRVALLLTSVLAVLPVLGPQEIPKGLTDPQVLKHVVANLTEALAYAEKRGVMPLA